MSDIADLFRPHLVFFENVETSRELFRKIGQKLIDQGLVKPAFTEAIIEREKHYPTGLDMSAVGTDIPNVAIPHTETDYCNTDRIVVVKLENEIPFHNMITPKKQLNVKFAFFILNGKKSAQTNILSSLMESFTQNWDLKTLSQFNTEKDIFQYIQSKTEKGSV
ncbi:PTS sugar transporter subunit IIA [Bacillus sonorensis]|uniref:PTS system galactitol/fructose specific transporter subunit IIBC n=2 Tax=Bacillus sonorensis TaxID=119858 RepID=M5P2V1_9BACI|nr:MULTISPECIES: PTS sugar transporter subunit IIA [Bacillus]TWK83531.1 hypothetical protein CHCC20335_4602 [Bacillus paralicheniformis]ASB91395.1 Protein-N(pi)-phosphohistidine--sugar phosphotransferase [Bacillus sonorensis]EME73764.1 PTS system galactitol/fructose specific transporter subunit IIBC [Bacillus sonorensis L12]MBG9914710.1 PTS fructose transporter subunit IIA [Bacillus sonorensis]MCF7615995.1 PTS sugar transporter subunit IIA [Bacillus sonorensis]